LLKSVSDYVAVKRGKITILPSLRKPAASFHFESCLTSQPGSIYFIDSNVKY